MSDPIALRHPLADYLGLFAHLIESRKAQGLSQEEVARRIGISRRAFQEWENAGTDPSVPQFIRWAGALGVSISMRNESAGSCANVTLADVPLPHHGRLVADALAKAGRAYLPMERIVHILYGDDPSGGPDAPEAYVRTLVSRLRRCIRPLGYTVRHSRHLGYRLMALEAA